MNETEYHRKSEDSLNRIQNVLEEADQRGELELEYQGGILSIELPSGKQLLLSKHTASRQIWLSSPVSGGLHFSFMNDDWVLADGRTLSQVLSHELKTMAGMEVLF